MTNEEAAADRDQAAALDATQRDATQMDATQMDDAQMDAIVGRGPSGAFAVAGVATAIVIALYFAFYFFVYLPRGIVQ